MASPVAIGSAPGVSTGGVGLGTPSGLALRLRAWLRRPELDAAIARGLHGQRDPALALREAQLVAIAQRRRLATRLEEVLATPSPPRGSASTVPVDRGGVERARPVLADVVDLLRSSSAVAPRGMAMGWRMLTEPGSSLYESGERETNGGDRLRREALTVLEELGPA